MSDVWNDLFDKEEGAEESSEAAVLRIKSQLFGQVFDQVKAMSEHQSQKDIGVVLGIHQPHVSEILQGKMSRFSLEKIIELAGKVRLEVSFSTTLKRA